MSKYHNIKFNNSENSNSTYLNYIKKLHANVVFEKRYAIKKKSRVINLVFHPVFAHKLLLGTSGRVPQILALTRVCFVSRAGDKTAAVQRIDSGSPGSVSQPHQRNSAAVTLVATLIISSLLLPYYINSLSHSTAIRTVSCR